MDRQSLAGKAPVGVARRTPEGIPVLAICGSLEDDLPDFPVGNIQAAFPIIARADSLDKILEQAEQNLIRTARNIGNLLEDEKKRLVRFFSRYSISLTIMPFSKKRCHKTGHQNHF